MRIALIYSLTDSKLSKETYSQTYRGQFLALQEICDMEITESCDARSLDADVIIFYDIHSSHRLEILGIASHSAIKYEYFNDPHQIGAEGVYTTGQYTKKLDARERSERALRRNVDFIICPFTEPFYNHIAPHLQGRADDMFLWFPTAPAIELYMKRHISLSERTPKILGNGATWGIEPTGYGTRRWAYKQSFVCNIEHTLNGGAPSGERYPNYLSGYAASLALTDDHIVPKYLEIPLAGCVCFASKHKDYKNMGFIDGVNCYFVDKSNLKDKAEHFLNHIEEHQTMADEGRKLIEKNWTAKHFAKFIYNHAEKQLSK